MTAAFLNIAVATLILIGSVFSLVAALGLLRLPDLYTRMHAASKAGTLGSGIMLLAIMIDSQQIDVATRAVAGIIFFLLTAPLAAHLLARAAYIVGVRPHPSTTYDDTAHIGLDDLAK